MCFVYTSDALILIRRKQNTLLFSSTLCFSVFSTFSIRQMNCSTQNNSITLIFLCGKRNLFKYIEICNECVFSLMFSVLTNICTTIHRIEIISSELGLILCLNCTTCNLPFISMNFLKPFLYMLI